MHITQHLESPWSNNIQKHVPRARAEQIVRGSAMEFNASAWVQCATCGAVCKQHFQSDADSGARASTTLQYTSVPIRVRSMCEGVCR
jgi:hypothetical protein